MPTSVRSTVLTCGILRLGKVNQSLQSNETHNRLAVQSEISSQRRIQVTERGLLAYNTPSANMT